MTIDAGNGSANGSATWRTAPGGCTFTWLLAQHPDAGALAALWRALGEPFPLVRGPAPRLLAGLATPLGERILG